MADHPEKANNVSCCDNNDWMLILLDFTVSL